ncbi:MAG: exodeoxyribonuclease III [Candidatus Nomurabacteria bacterium]|jgi:exodeoxyribonuclease-3|nr:exodeoxyribonuclease III [Candidatus Nomurabacteria bacterium]
MKIFSWNINGIRAAINKGDFAKFIAKYQPDILCLQETKAKKGQADIDLPDYEEYWNDADRAGYSGTAIFTKLKPLEVRFGFSDAINKKYNFADNFGDAAREGRVTTIEFEDFYLVTQYTPNAKRELERLEFRAGVWDPAFLEYVKELKKTKPVIFCGDLNVAHREIDLARPKDNVGNAGFTDEERKGFQNYLRAGFVDTFRALHGDEAGAYTWWTWRANARARNIGWRIDYFLATKDIAPRITEASIYPTQAGSDHCPISIDFS